MVRMTCDPATKAYVARRRAEGKTHREIVRCLKRYVAREVYRLLTNPPVVPNGAELRIARNAARISLATAAEALGTWPTRISQLERAITHDAELANRYQACDEDPCRILNEAGDQAPVRRDRSRPEDPVAVWGSGARQGTNTPLWRGRCCRTQQLERPGR